MSKDDIAITLSDDGAALTVIPGASILSTAQQNDIDIIATCGGRGRCRSCRVKILKGDVTKPSVADTSQLSIDEINEGYRLSCQCFPVETSSYSIAPPTHETSFQILSEPGSWHDMLDSIDHNTEFDTPYGIAFDIGTTTVVGYLINLQSGKTLASVSGLNPQTVFGGDLISRITFAAEKPANVKKLTQRITSFMSDLIASACDQAEIKPIDICKVCIVGNTCMHHLFLGIDPTPLGSAPYDPVMVEPHTCTAKSCGFKLHENANVYMLPIIAGFVGADTVAVILSAHIQNRPGVVIAADIGTNCEVVLKTDQSMIAASSPAGPALEGGQIRDGMRAALGAIDKVSYGDDIEINTIGEAPALGICGSGLIDGVAVMLELGIINKMGRLLLEPKKVLKQAIMSRLRKGEDGLPEFVLVWAKDSGNSLDIVLNQTDIRQLQLAKAAIMSDVEALLQQVDMTLDDIDEFLLAGGFGNYISIENSKRIGLIPNLPEGHIQYIANAAGLGSQMVLLSDQAKVDAETIALKVQHLSLAGYEGFQKMYLGAMSFPAGAK
jgi:uncharacterized 2Fe-2S/4Fe-4S cluster protein (DUF4445 family)